MDTEIPSITIHMVSSIDGYISNHDNSILPILLGKGLPFFKQLNKEHRLQLIDTKAYKNGMIELSYKIMHLQK